MSTNRSPLWALIGVVVGFGLPALLCLGLAFSFFIGLGSLGASPTSMQSDQQVYISGPASGPAVAIIRVSGPIVSGREPAFSSGSSAAAEDIKDLIRQAERDSQVRAVVIDLNSPGGSVVPSDEIYSAFADLNLPVVVAMGDVAASGGYYISMAADYIFANPNTLTGSIGVISSFPNAQELLEKIGVEFTTITSGEAKDFGSPYREMSEEEQAYWQSIVDETYSNFVEIVVEGRDLSEEQVRALADGRVFTGKQALELGLVDGLGYLEDAINKAAELADIPGEPRVVRYEKYSTIGSLLQGLQPGGGLQLPANWWQGLISPSLQFLWVP